MFNIPGTQCLHQPNRCNPDMLVSPISQDDQLKSNKYTSL